MRIHVSRERRIPIAAAMVALISLPAAACRETNRPADPGSDASAASFERSRDERVGFTKVSLDGCTFIPEGKNAFMNLTPGYTLVLAGQDEDEFVDLRITVLNRTKLVGGITTRVIEERELKDGELYEIALNYFAMCKETNSIYYFGEDVDFYENGVITSHDGSWLHGVRGARAGLQMPGLPLLGSRYFQEIAEGVALDRAEILRLDATVTTPFARFSNVLLTEETSPLTPGVKEEKFYAPDIGLIKDGPVVLVKAGFSIR